MIRRATRSILVWAALSFAVMLAATNIARADVIPTYTIDSLQIQACTAGSCLGGLWTGTMSGPQASIQITGSMLDAGTGIPYPVESGMPLNVYFDADLGAAHVNTALVGGVSALPTFFQSSQLHFTGPATVPTLAIGQTVTIYGTANWVLSTQAFHEDQFNQQGPAFAAFIGAGSGIMRIDIQGFDIGNGHIVGTPVYMAFNSSVPEPGTLVLCGIGLLSTGFGIKFKRSR